MLNEAKPSTGDSRYDAVDATMQRFNYQQHGLVETLITAQDEFGYLPQELLQFVAEKLAVPLSQVYGVATFYDMFSLEEIGKTECRICVGPVCQAKGAHDILEETRRVTHPQYRQKERLPNGTYTISETPCIGLCDQAPAAIVNQTGQVNLTFDSIESMLRMQADIPQIRISGEPRILTGSIGKLPPTHLLTHRMAGTFEPLEIAICTMTPERIITEVKQSRLTGRGGAGFQTGLKWELARNTPDKPRIVVCNFDESEPGTFKDRVLMEGDPFRVITGMIISAYAIDAEKGYIFIRGEYQAASAVIEDALENLRNANLLGDNILQTDFSFDIEVRQNAGAYICGEETALFEAIEGKRGHPRTKPPYPTQSGLFGKPTVINNVETLAAIPGIILNGGSWFTQWGTRQSAGVKLFCLSGHVNNPGVIEAPFGLTFNEIIEHYGGGYDGTPLAILMGGAAGGFIPPYRFDTPITHEDLSTLDVPVGSGAIMVFNETVNLWQVLESLADFFVHETCGQCGPCRLGTRQIYYFLQKVNKGTTRRSDWQKVEDLGKTIRTTCFCGLGLTAANPLLTVLHNFEAAV